MMGILGLNAEANSTSFRAAYMQVRQAIGFESFAVRSFCGLGWFKVPAARDPEPNRTIGKVIIAVLVKMKLQALNLFLGSQQELHLLLQNCEEFQVQEVYVVVHHVLFCSLQPRHALIPDG